MLVDPVRLRQSSLAAVVRDTTIVHDDSNQVSDPTPIHDEPTRDSENTEDEDSSSEGVNDGKMIRVCDKLIEVFMVDKPTPTDWRRLLAFSKEWNNLRSHFYKRCQDRADSEEDPGMKHKLLRLGRKLKEVGCTI